MGHCVLVCVFTCVCVCACMYVYMCVPCSFDRVEAQRGGAVICAGWALTVLSGDQGELVLLYVFEW